MRVALFLTCYNDALFPDTGKAVVRVLERLGHEVEFPEGQTCCGQMHWNTGYQTEALPAVTRFLNEFEPYEAIVIPSSSCVAMMREHYPMMARRIDNERAGGNVAERIEALLPRVWEFTEFLTKKLGITDVGATYPHRVTCHASCHGLRGLGLGDGPEQLLKNVRGLELVQLERPEQCCGFGGTFAVKNAETSGAMLAEKLTSIENTEAEVCTAADNSCLLHIEGGLHRAGSKTRALHIAEILAGEDA